MSTRYEQGRGFAYRVSRKLADDGYEIIRSAGSKTKVDVFAFKSWPSADDAWQTHARLFVQVKKSTNGTIPVEERAELIRLAIMDTPIKQRPKPPVAARPPRAATY